MAQPVLHRSSAGAPVTTLPEEATSCLSALLQATGLGLAYLDAELRFRFVSPAFTLLSGLPATAYESRSVGEVWPGLSAAMLPLLQRALAGEPVLGVPVSGVLNGAAGTPRHFRLSVFPAAPGAPGGAPPGLSLTIEDDTERMQRERTLREREEQLRGIVAISCDGYCLHSGGVVIQASESMARTLGTTVEGMLGQPILKWIAPESRESVQRSVARLVDSPYEATGLRVDGRRLFLEMLPMHVQHEGRQVRMVTIWDISARKATEDAAARSEAFRDQLMRALGQDVRPSIQALRKGVRAVLDALTLNEAQTRQVAQLNTTAQRLERMVQQLMDYTRARLVGGIPAAPVPLALDRLVDRVVDEVRAGQPGRAVVFKKEGSLVGTWDEAQLTRMLEHLVDNALLHGPETAPVELSLAGQADGVTLSVRSDGPPIPLEERAQLFEPFKRGKRARGEGLGLGLYIVRQIVTSHGGRVSVESGTGLGTRFVVWLPAHAPGC